MIFQAYPHSCGAAAVTNALRCFGIKVSENKVMSEAGTISPYNCAHCLKVKAGKDTDESECAVGTDEKGILRALRALGKDKILAAPQSCESKQVAWGWLRNELMAGRVVILCLDNFGHWATAIGLCGPRVIVVDPQKTQNNLKENGINVVSKSSLISRWWNSSSEVIDGKRLYGISVGLK